MTDYHGSSSSSALTGKIRKSDAEELGMFLELIKVFPGTLIFRI